MLSRTTDKGTVGGIGRDEAHNSRPFDIPIVPHGVQLDRVLMDTLQRSICFWNRSAVGYSLKHPDSCFLVSPRSTRHRLRSLLHGERIEDNSMTESETAKSNLDLINPLFGKAACRVLEPQGLDMTSG